ncbi:MAG: alpha/beta fold hydrolase [Deltaproteobacteria bacterium]|nr:alpha/beta fold hydrolase [Deltaproteobacteria bacterium]
MHARAGLSRSRFLFGPAVVVGLGWLAAGCNAGRASVATDAGAASDALVRGEAGRDAVSLPADRGVSDDAGPVLADAAVPSLAWGACDTTSWPTGYPMPTAGVQCAAVEVPLDHADPKRGSFTLRVARQKSRSFPTGKAIFNLAGGPGGAAVTQSGTIPYAMPQALETFDLVYVDQRGTGGSGYLDCSAGYPDTKAEWIVCAGEHAKKPLGYYLTRDAADDVDFVRRRLGYAKIHLRGGSYGTRLGLEVLRRHGSVVIAAVLDGVAPPDWDFFAEVVKAGDWAVTRLVEECGKSTDCKSVAPDLGADLAARRAALKLAPRPMLVNGKTMLEDEATFVDLLTGLLDDPRLRYRVPRAIHAAAGGQHGLWNALIGEAFGVTVTDPPKSSPRGPGPLPTMRPLRRRGLGASYVAPGMHATVVCAEWWPNASGGPAALRTLAAEQLWSGSTAEYMIGFGEACSAWNVAPLPGADRAAVTSSVKTLLLSGDADLRTPPHLGDHTLKTLSAGTHLVVPYAGHSTLMVPCAAQIASDFLAADGNLAAVDTTCLKRLKPPTW